MTSSHSEVQSRPLSVNPLRVIGGAAHSLPLPLSLCLSAGTLTLLDRCAHFIGIGLLLFGQGRVQERCAGDGKCMVYKQNNNDEPKLALRSSNPRYRPDTPSSLSLSRSLSCSLSLSLALSVCATVAISLHLCRSRVYAPKDIDMLFFFSAGGRHLKALQMVLHPRQILQI